MVDFVSLSGDGDDLALLRIQFHHPFGWLCPFSQFIESSCNCCMGMSMILDGEIDDSIISKEAYFHVIRVDIRQVLLYRS